MGWLRKKWRAFKCWLGLHLEQDGTYTETTRPFFSYRHHYRCNYCGSAFYIKTSGGKYWGG
jgi:hypothetical protein